MSVYSAFVGLSQFILPLPVVHTINSSGSLFVFVIDFVINKVKINCQQAIGIFIGFCGVLLAANGKLIMAYFTHEYDKQT